MHRAALCFGSAILLFAAAFLATEAKAETSALKYEDLEGAWHYETDEVKGTITFHPGRNIAIHQNQGDTAAEEGAMKLVGREPGRLIIELNPPDDEVMELAVTRLGEDRLQLEGEGLPETLELVRENTPPAEADGLRYADIAGSWRLSVEGDSAVLEFKPDAGEAVVHNADGSSETAAMEVVNEGGATLVVRISVEGEGEELKLERAGKDKLQMSSEGLPEAVFLEREAGEAVAPDEADKAYLSLAGRWRSEAGAVLEFDPANDSLALFDSVSDTESDDAELAFVSASKDELVVRLTPEDGVPQEVTLLLIDETHIAITSDEDSPSIQLNRIEP